MRERRKVFACEIFARRFIGKEFSDVFYGSHLFPSDEVKECAV